MTPHDNLVNQTCIPENDGYLFNTFQKNFETDEEKNFFRVYNPDKNGKSKHQISPLEI